MAFTIIDPKIPQRTPQLLIQQAIPNPWVWVEEGAERPLVVPYDEVAPGLYPGETVVELDTGEIIAVSVATKRLANGGGLEFRGWARQIEPDGRTKRDPAGQEMELEFPTSASPAVLAALETDEETAKDRISREVMLMMLGEPPTMRPVHVDPEAPVPEVAVDAQDFEDHPEKAPPGTILNPEATEVPILPLSDEVRSNASIRFALQMARATNAEVDVSPLLQPAEDAISAS